MFDNGVVLALLAVVGVTGAQAVVKKARTGSFDDVPVLGSLTGMLGSSDEYGSYDVEGSSSHHHRHHRR